MYKFITFAFAFVLFFNGCEDKKPQTIEQNDTIPNDIPIAIGETNTTINENFPPEPVMEKPNE